MKAALAAGEKSPVGAALNREDLAEDRERDLLGTLRAQCEPYRAADPRHLRRIRHDTVLTQPVEQLLQAAGVPAHVVSSASDLAADPDLTGGHYRRIDDPVVGEAVIEGPRFRLARTPTCETRRGPRIGEHTQAVLREWWRVIRPGGHLVLYLPHKAHYPNIGQPGANPAHKHDFLPEDIVKAME